jgi:hypothetical protein
MQCEPERIKPGQGQQRPGAAPRAIPDRHQTALQSTAPGRRTQPAASMSLNCRR